VANRPRSTENEWIVVGYELLGEGGPEAVRIDEIARRLGVARSGFYHRFGSKRALWDAINERWMADGFDAYLRAGALGSPLERLRGIGYFGLGNERLRRADQWLLVHGPQTMDLSEHVENVRGRAVSWVAPHLVELGFEPTEAERRAYVYYVAYLGLGADISARPEPVDERELRQLVDSVVDVVVTPSTVRSAV
jgi:AcrR family transcriptional regulator